MNIQARILSNQERERERERESGIVCETNKMKQFELEIVIKHSPKDVWRVWMKNFQITLPKAIPQHYTSIEYLDGPPLATGGVGQINYNVESNSPSLHMDALYVCVCVFVCIHFYYLKLCIIDLMYKLLHYLFIMNKS